MDTTFIFLFKFSTRFILTYNTHDYGNFIVAGCVIKILDHFLLKSTF